MHDLTPSSLPLDADRIAAHVARRRLSEAV
jgi:hypothetical protein